MTVTFLGVRHHSPTCAQLVAETIQRLRPAFVLIEGPAEMNDRLDELLVGHELPIAVFTGFRDAERHHMSWAPLCAYSPEWVALQEGSAVGAEVRFIDLPAWHSALVEHENRYADAEKRYCEAVGRLCREFAVDNVDTLWDELFEIGGPDLSTRLDAYFDLIRGQGEVSPQDTERESYMSSWVAAAVAHAPHAEIVVVTGGFHRPALVRAMATSEPDSAWPAVPEMPPAATGGTYLVPFSFRRLDAFAGYQSGMPSPAYYQHRWEHGAQAAAEYVVESVVSRLRTRRVVVSTADLIGAQTMIGGLARLRGHSVPTRTDVLDGLASALIDEALEHPLPWTGRGRPHPHTHPVVAEMVVALSGRAVGRLHPDTPQPPLVADAEAELARCGVALLGATPLEVRVDLADPTTVPAGVVLNRLRVLDIPGFTRVEARARKASTLIESWSVQDTDLRLPALIEASSWGPTLVDAATTRLRERFNAAGGDPAQLAAVLLDAVACDLGDLLGMVLADSATAIRTTTELPGLGVLLAAAVDLWRSRSLDALVPVIDEATIRLLWLVEGVRGRSLPDDAGTLHSLIAIRDAVVHARDLLSSPLDDIFASIGRAAHGDRPPALRGAAMAMLWVLADAPDLARTEGAIRHAGRPDTLGDFLSGLLAIARDHILTPEVVRVLNELVRQFSDLDFLTALPGLRLAFAWLPPRERAALADQLLQVHGLSGNSAGLLRVSSEPESIAYARLVEDRVEAVLLRDNLLSIGDRP
ncbi:DUF5682 family protein [Nocardia noduli]|uniref:DUF5682 family protein n=1 Tax=Nocardia noduli TaxID=2815722 RepID=UPI001C24B81B|nr:DUF5682 family protein [Nocardia noduli]